MIFFLVCAVIVFQLLALLYSAAENSSLHSNFYLSFCHSFRPGSRSWAVTKCKRQGKSVVMERKRTSRKSISKGMVASAKLNVKFN